MSKTTLPTHCPPDSDLYIKPAKSGRPRAPCWEKIRLSRSHPDFAFCIFCSNWLRYSGNTTNLNHHRAACWASNQKKIVEFVDNGKLPT